MYINTIKAFDELMANICRQKTSSDYSCHPKVFGYILLTCASFAIILMGYLFMAKIDRFIEENREARKEEETDEVQEDNEG